MESRVCGSHCGVDKASTGKVVFGAFRLQELLRCQALLGNFLAKILRGWLM